MKFLANNQYRWTTISDIFHNWRKRPRGLSNAMPNKPFHPEQETDDNEIDEHGNSMDLPIEPTSIVPDRNGFKKFVQQLNPQIQPFLLDRITTEQVRRYKRLLVYKVKHAQAVQRSCGSADLCNVLGSGPRYIELEGSGKRLTKTAQFAILGQVSQDQTSSEGEVMTLASFPNGVPLPPVERLPAEFECSLCFKVKKFQKPTDWTKHVFEDLQPFICTFPHCTETKSFKRKADWVRHENERHRKLEWWQWNIPECNHICYRKDNFVQHLVREHKVPEPNTRPRGSSGRAPEPAEVWRLVESCHISTDKRSRDEPCRFCGNVCNDWKRLTVHQARHMEQISFPVLKLVEQKSVTHDTIINPVSPVADHLGDMSSTKVPWTLSHVDECPPVRPTLPPISEVFGPSLSYSLPELASVRPPVNDGSAENMIPGKPEQFGRWMMSTQSGPSIPVDEEGYRTPGPGVLVDGDSDEEEPSEDGNTSFVLFPPDAEPQVRLEQRDDVRTTAQTSNEAMARYMLQAEGMDTASIAAASDIDDDLEFGQGKQAALEVYTPSMPSTSRAALEQYKQTAEDLETASRAASWGTRRRISESEIGSPSNDEHNIRRLSITPILALDPDKSQETSNIGHPHRSSNPDIGIDSVASSRKPHLHMPASSKLEHHPRDPSVPVASDAKTNPRVRADARYIHEDALRIQKFIDDYNPQGVGKP